MTGTEHAKAMREAEPMTDKVDELLPCPFCGGEPFVEPKNPKTEGDAWTRISCQNGECYVSASVRINADNSHYAQAAEAWNARTPTPPSDDLRAAMEALRAGGNPTNNTIDDAYIGRMFDNCNAVLAAWDAQQGERS